MNNLRDEGFKTGVVYHENYLLHEHSPTHPERRERLMYTMDQLEEEGIFDLPQVNIFEPSKAERKELARVHTDEYLDELESTSHSGQGKAIDSVLFQQPCQEIPILEMCTFVHDQVGRPPKFT